MSAFLLRFKVNYPEKKKRSYPNFSLWIPIALAKVYFSHVVLTRCKNLCIQQAPSLKAPFPKSLIMVLFISDGGRDDDSWTYHETCITEALVDYSSSSKRNLSCFRDTCAGKINRQVRVQIYRTVHIFFPYSTLVLTDFRPFSSATSAVISAITFF